MRENTHIATWKRIAGEEKTENTQKSRVRRLSRWGSPRTIENPEVDPKGKHKLGSGAQGYSEIRKWSRNRSSSTSSRGHGAHALMMMMMMLRYDDVRSAWTRMMRMRMRMNASSRVLHNMLFISQGFPPPAAGLRIPQRRPRHHWVPIRRALPLALACHSHEFPGGARWGAKSCVGSCSNDVLPVKTLNWRNADTDTTEWRSAKTTTQCQGQCQVALERIWRPRVGDDKARRRRQRRSGCARRWTPPSGSRMCPPRRGPSTGWPPCSP